MTSPDRYYRAALICGLAPLAAGIGVFSLWVFGRWHWLPFAGLVTILGGAGLLIVGAILLRVYVIRARRAGPQPQIRRRVRIALTVLLINFPAALMITLAVPLFPSDDNVRFEIVNGGPDIQRFVLSGACDEIDFGTIASGATRQETIAIEHNGRLEFHALRGGQDIGGEVDQNVIPGQRLQFVLTFSPNGDWSVQRIIILF